MEQTATSRDAAGEERFTAPYRPSWVDRLTAWVARRPGPAWLYYLGMAALFCVSYLLVKWWEGGPIVISPGALLTVGSAFYYLGAIHYLDVVARDAMMRFRLAIEAPAQRVADLEYRLTTMPTRWVWLMTLVGALEGGLIIMGLVTGYLSYPDLVVFASPPAAVLEVAIILLVWVFFVLGV